MEYIDLGARAEPVLLFGSSYSNVHATSAMLDWATEYKFADDHRIMRAILWLTVRSQTKLLI